MAQRSFEVIFLEGVDEFLSTLTPKARAKIIYNVRKVKGGVMDADINNGYEGLRIRGDGR